MLQFVKINAKINVVFNEQNLLKTKAKTKNTTFILALQKINENHHCCVTSYLHCSLLCYKLFKTAIYNMLTHTFWPARALSACLPTLPAGPRCPGCATFAQRCLLSRNISEKSFNN